MRAQAIVILALALGGCATLTPAQQDKLADYKVFAHRVTHTTAWRTSRSWWGTPTPTVTGSA
jgi:hypothetical protein